MTPGKAKQQMKNKSYIDRGLEPPAEIQQIRESARNGAASILGNRPDVLDDIASSTVSKYLHQVVINGDHSIPNPRSWAFRVGRNEATAWRERERKQISLDAAPDNGDGLEAHERLLGIDNLSLNSPLFGAKDEILQALPELFDWFQHHVVDELEDEDRRFYELYYIDKSSEEKIARELKISQKAVAQRWRRLLFRLRRRLLQELPGWERGNELFADAFRDPKSIGDLLCLISLFVKQGIDAIRGIIESFE